MRLTRTSAFAVAVTWAVAGLPATASALPVLDAYVVTYLANDAPYEVHGPYGDYVNGTPFEYRPFPRVRYPRLASYFSRTRTVTTRTVSTTVVQTTLRRRTILRAARRSRFPRYASAFCYGLRYRDPTRPHG